MRYAFALILLSALTSPCCADGNVSATEPPDTTGWMHVSLVWEVATPQHLSVRYVNAIDVIGSDFWWQRSLLPLDSDPAFELSQWAVWPVTGPPSACQSALGVPKGNTPR